MMKQNLNFQEFKKDIESVLVKNGYSPQMYSILIQFSTDRYSIIQFSWRHSEDNPSVGYGGTKSTLNKVICDLGEIISRNGFNAKRFLVDFFLGDEEFNKVSSAHQSYLMSSDVISVKEISEQAYGSLQVNRYNPERLITKSR